MFELIRGMDVVNLTYHNVTEFGLSFDADIPTSPSKTSVGIVEQIGHSWEVQFWYCNVHIAQRTAVTDLGEESSLDHQSNPIRPLKRHLPNKN